MIFAKITPELSMVEQSGMFNPQVTYKTASYMAAVADPYPLGADKVDFTLMYGTFKVEGPEVYKDFEVIHRERIQLTGEELEDWGTDDSVVLHLIAAKQGTEVVEVVTGEKDRFFF